jgi:hypothetical protein
MTSRSNVCVIGYGKPPKNHRFRKGESGAELTAGQLEDST